jgi:hypothetical protein
VELMEGNINQDEAIDNTRQARPKEIRVVANCVGMWGYSQAGVGLTTSDCCSAVLFDARG